MPAALTHPHWSANSRLQDAAADNPAMCVPETGPAVVLLQEALDALGYKLPKSTKTPATATSKAVFDGVYGMEVVNRVIEFQRDFYCKPDGAAGYNTLRAMDDQLTKRGLLLGGGGGGGGTTTPPIVQVWINVFIPEIIPGLTAPNKSGMGGTVISQRQSSFIPGISETRTIATDGRSFSSALPSLTSIRFQMHAMVTVDFTKVTPTTPPPFTTTFNGGTNFFLDNSSHMPLLGRKIAIVNTGGGFVPKPSPIGAMKFAVDFKLTHPLNFTGLMTVAGDLTVSPGGAEWGLMLSSFPAFEGYMSKGAKLETLFTEGVVTGATPASLDGGSTRLTKGTKKF